MSQNANGACSCQAEGTIRCGGQNEIGDRNSANERPQETAFFRFGRAGAVPAESSCCSSLVERWSVALSIILSEFSRDIATEGRFYRDDHRAKTVPGFLTRDKKAGRPACSSGTLGIRSFD